MEHVEGTGWVEGKREVEGFFSLTLHVCKIHSFHTHTRNIMLINITIKMISEFDLCLIKKRKSKLKMLTYLK